MLIEFSLANFLSFKERATLSLEASPDEWLAESHVAEVAGRRILKTAAIYGANASGKSNFLEGMNLFRRLVMDSSKESQLGDAIDVMPFTLSTQTENLPSLLEAVFLEKGVKYRYGFEADAKQIHSEWLFRQGNSIRESRMFLREGARIKVSQDFKEGKGLQEKTRPNALFLSVVSQFNGEISGEVMNWIKRFRMVSGLNADAYMIYSARKLKEKDFGNQIRSLTRSADVGIDDLSMEEISIEERRKSLPNSASEAVRREVLDPAKYAFSVRSWHRKYDAESKVCGRVEFDLKTRESSGTQKFIALSGPFLDTLNTGSVSFVDEIEAQFHPLLTKAMVGLFNSFENNKNAQLIYATHEDGLLDPSRIRRDQIWFVEKDEFGASQLYCLAEFNVRKEAKFGKEYLLGNFGAIPHLRRFQMGLTNGKEKI